MLSLLIFIGIGVLSGWLASMIMGQKEFSFWPALFLGVAGALIGGAIFTLVGLKVTTHVNSLLCGVLGGIIILYTMKLLNNK